MRDKELSRTVIKEIWCELNSHENVLWWSPRAWTLGLHIPPRHYELDYYAGGNTEHLSNAVLLVLCNTQNREGYEDEVGLVNLLFGDCLGIEVSGDNKGHINGAQSLRVASLTFSHVYSVSFKCMLRSLHVTCCFCC